MLCAYSSPFIIYLLSQPLCFQGISDNRKAGKYPASLRNGVDESDRAYKWLHNKAKVKDALKHTYLGYETKDLVDVVTGDITTIQSLRHTSDLDTGEMYVFLCKVEAWAMNIGCHLTIPQSCEFQLLRDKQEA
ncbi:hypothetical protein ECTOK1_C06930 [Escherichia coli]|nr:hypothetical protein ECTOK1_C06930 [Escherichia coli]